MKLMISRFIAILMLVIPGIAAMTGFLKIKDALFDYMSKHGDDSLAKVTFDWLQFGFGLLLFAAGVGFLGGWIFSATANAIMLDQDFVKKNPRKQSKINPAHE